MPNRNVEDLLKDLDQVDDTIEESDRIRGVQSNPLQRPLDVEDAEDESEEMDLSPPRGELLYEDRWTRQDGADMSMRVFKFEDKVDEVMYENDRIIWRNIEHRPFIIGSGAGAATNSMPIHAITIDFLIKKGLDPSIIFFTAYPDGRGNTYSLENQTRIIERAELQGVVFPDEYGAIEKNLLIEDLHDINFHSLAGVIEELDI